MDAHAAGRRAHARAAIVACVALLRGRALDARRRAAPCTLYCCILSHVSPRVDGVQVYAVVAVAWPRVGGIVTGGGVADSRVAEMGSADLVVMYLSVLRRRLRSTDPSFERSSTK